MSIWLSPYDLQYTKGQLSQNLYKILQKTLPECNYQKINEFLIMRTLSQLLNFLVIKSSPQPEHYVFTDMMSDLGVIITIDLWL